MKTGRLYIIPIPISDGDHLNVLPSGNIDLTKELRHFVVEKVKTARQFLRKIDRTFPIDDTEFYELNKHEGYSFQLEAIEKLKSGIDVGLMSESGYPGVADPGSEFVALAHKNEVEIIPFIGPSSILLALSASGMNGQGFTFCGYLPKKDPERSSEIKRINQVVNRTGYAQIFIETPYRNEVMLKDFTSYCGHDLRLTIAFDVTGAKQLIRTKTISEWKNSPFKFDKTPCVFILGV